MAPDKREECEATIGYTFKDPKLLDRAMTHRSAVVGRSVEWSNERLEFLGDRVLGLVVVEALLERFPNTREGELAPKLNSIVSRETCAIIGAELGLERFLIVAGSEKASGASKPSLLANAMEAILGGIYLDSGLPKADQFVRRHWKAFFNASEDLQRDPKTLLQEWAQADGRAAPIYTHKRQGGPDHAPKFVATVIVDGLEPLTGHGTSKQDAEREAARLLLEQIGPTSDD